jgi:hypothetical protein
MAGHCDGLMTGIERLPDDQAAGATVGPEDSEPHVEPFGVAEESLARSASFAAIATRSCDTGTVAWQRMERNLELR